MIVVQVTLHSAITGAVTELARMEICNDGSHANAAFGNYTARTLRGRCAEHLNRRIQQRTCGIANWPRKHLHIWNLVADCLNRMKYGAANE